MRACNWLMVVGWAGWARSHFFIVCWNRSTLPQVVGWLGREFFCTMFAAAQLVLEVVASAAAAGEAGGVDGAVVGEGGPRVAVLGGGLGEGGDHGRGAASLDLDCRDDQPGFRHG